MKEKKNATINKQQHRQPRENTAPVLKESHKILCWRVFEMKGIFLS